MSLFTDWQKGRVNEVWVKRRLEQGAVTVEREFYGAKPATTNVHPIVELSAENCTAQMGVPGPWYDRLPHFRMGFTPSSGKELQSEYFVPRMNAVEAIQAVERLRDHVSPHLMITELRTIDSDDLWMSTCYQRASLAIHFTWKPEWDAVRQVLPMIERELAPFDVRPHWGKLFTIPPKTLQGRYPKCEDFKRLLAEHDPQGKFRNAFLATTVRRHACVTPAARAGWCWPYSCWLRPQAAPPRSRLPWRLPPGRTSPWLPARRSSCSPSTARPRS